MNDELTHDQATITTRAANEGIPIAAIARIVQQPFDLISVSLRHALASGQIGDMPKADWPPAMKWSERHPTIPRGANAEDIEFQCRQAFKLTRLEAGFMVALLRYDCADKERLHGVVEQQRAARATRLDKQELTDPKMVDVIICKLRKKLKAVSPEVILHTSWGRGYYFDPKMKQQIFALMGGPFGQETAPGGDDTDTGRAGSAPSAE